MSFVSPVVTGLANHINTWMVGVDAAITPNVLSAVSAPNVLSAVSAPNVLKKLSTVGSDAATGIVDVAQRLGKSYTDKGYDHLSQYISHFYSRPWHGFENDPNITLIITNPIAVRQILSYINSQTQRVQGVTFSGSTTRDSPRTTNAMCIPYNSGDLPLVYMFAYPHPSVGFLFGDLPHVYSAHQPWTALGGSFEISQHSPVNLTDNPGAENQDAGHIANGRGLRITLRKSDKPHVVKMLAEWQCVASTVRYIWRGYGFVLSPWTCSQTQCNSAMVSRIIRSLDAFRKLRRHVENMRKSPVARSLCVILHGEPGTGKSSIANEIALHFGLNLYEMCMPPPFEPNPSDKTMSEMTSDACLGEQLNQVAASGCESVVLLDDMQAGTNGQFKQFNVSRAKLLSICEGRDLPLKSVIVFTSNSTYEQLSGLYEDALCRPGRVRLMSVGTFSPDDIIRVRRVLKPTQRHLLETHLKLCSLVEAIVEST
jgi:hypothetical protein